MALGVENTSALVIKQKLQYATLKLSAIRVRFTMYVLNSNSNTTPTPTKLQKPM